MPRRSLSLRPLLPFALALAACGGNILIGNGPGDGGTRVGDGSPSKVDAGYTGPVVRNEAGLVISPPPAPIALPKVDILFDIDNSASMGDKQSYLIQAIPQMIARLVTPNCLDNNSGAATGSTADPTTGECPSGATPEFTAVHDMHIGVVTSSLGSRLGISSGTAMVCAPDQTVVSAPSSGSVTVSAYNDDKGHLINRTGNYGANTTGLSEAALPEGGGFLNWFPALGNSGVTPVTPPAPITTIGAQGQADTLVGDFTEIVNGVGESGCGIESQLESWYRFLIQPDPYLTLVNPAGKAAWSGVDATIIQQRHDFLRPDSVVAVVVLTDENDSEIDVRSFDGSGFYFMSNTYSPPRATSACATNPLSSACTSCGPGSTDPACTVNAGVYDQAADTNDWGWDLNLRHVRMQAKYGLSPQYPLTRYYNGLTSTTVPNRLGEYPSSGGSYTVGNNNCTNPLFAASLPTAADIPDYQDSSPTEIGTTLCKLPASTGRNASDVFYAHIGGVPHQLLQNDSAGCTAANCTGAASDPASCATDCAQKATISPSDWVSILGQGPAAYLPPSFTPSFDYTGIDPHMIESMTPRNMSGLPNSFPAPASNPSVSTLSGPTFAAGSSPTPDPINGREWTTNQGVHDLPMDLEYACIFPLPPASQRDCATIPDGTIENNSCNCIPAYSNANQPVAMATGNSSDEVPPLCAKTSTDGTITSAVSDYTVQVYAKAYPTIRELTLANMLGSQGVISSLCPIHPNDNAAGNDPLYGYRPAVNALIDRMRPALPMAQ